jgi:short-subunit dehydrogenase
MGARSKNKAIAAINDIQENHPSTDIHFLELDLSNFSSVIAAAKKIRDEETTLHGLINNAGIMGVPYSVTADGYEIQFQVSCLGFATRTAIIIRR